MIIEGFGLKGCKTDLANLDNSAESVGFYRWSWEYTRAVYDQKIEDKKNNHEYYVRFNVRAVEGKLEQPHAILVFEDAYIGRKHFPFGLDYDVPIPEEILKAAKQKLADLQAQLG
ncbi:MAG TPA: YugN family protein [Bacilli bacterium]